MCLLFGAENNGEVLAWLFTFLPCDKGYDVPLAYSNDASLDTCANVHLLTVQLINDFKM